MAGKEKVKKLPDEDQIRLRILNQIRNQTFHSPYNLNLIQTPIKTKVKENKADLENRELAQNIELKKTTLIVLFIFLAVETIIIFTYAFLQGTGMLRFHLEEWSFKLLVTATILQITYMLQVAVKHLFPDSKLK